MDVKTVMGEQSKCWLYYYYLIDWYSVALGKEEVARLPEQRASAFLGS
jgi:hypothetical protein